MVVQVEGGSAFKLSGMNVLVNNSYVNLRKSLLSSPASMF